MDEQTSLPKESDLDQFRTLLRPLRRDLCQHGKKSTDDLPSYRVAKEFAELHKIPGAVDLLKSTLLHRQAQYAEALLLIEKAEGALPKHLWASAIDIKGIILSGLTRYDEAIECHQKALDTPGYDTPGYSLNNMGSANFDKGDNNRAIECYQKALDTPGYDTPGYSLNNMGSAYSQKGNNDRAIECYQKALDTSGYDNPGDALNNMSLVYFQKGDNDRAIEYCQKALDTPGYDKPGDALNTMSLAYLQKGSNDRAIECCQKALDTPGYDTPGYSLNNMGWAYFRKGHNDRAIECYQKALDTPGFDMTHRARINLANSLREMGKLTEALAEVERVLREPDEENKHEPAKFIQGLIQEELAGIESTPEENVLASSPGRGEIDTPEERMLSKLQGSGNEQRDKYDDYLKRQASGRDDLFSCLRGWSSSVTLLEGGNDSHWRGGGYFLKWQGHGVVIDPGFDFIDNFHDAGYTGKEIGAVLVSHNHSDHNYDLRSLDDLRYELHKRWKVNPSGIDLRNYLVGLDEDTWMAFESTEKDFRTLVQLDVKKSVRQKWLKRPLDMPMTVEHFPVDHGEDVSHAVGMRLLLHPKSAGEDFIIGYTGDTEYFDVLPKHLEQCDILLAHISMPDVEELGFDKAAAGHSKKKHLGYNGLAKLITETKPKLTLVGEFWAGRADIRLELIQGLRKKTGVNAILPTGLGFHLHMPSLEVECTNCRKRVDHSKIKVAPAATPFGPLGYLCISCIA